MPAIQNWNNPGSKWSVAAVDVGIVVSVRIWTSDPTGISVLGPDANGVPPHLLYLATVEPDGTGAFQLYDSVFGIYGRQTSDRPTGNQSGRILDQNQPNAPEAILYQLDLGVPFRCPWPGQIFVNGGAWIPVGGDPPPVVPYQIQVVRTMPQEVSIGKEGIVEGPQIHEEVYRQVYRTTGNRRLRNPRMTFLNVPTDAANKIPRGAVAVFVPTATTINFYPSGSPVTGVVSLPAPIPMTVPGGIWMPLGYLAEGYFAVPEGPAPLISFEVEIG